jgi:toxin ParE1/3/4
MRRKTLFHAIAKSDMTEIAKRIRANDPAAAKRFLQGIRRTSSLLLKFPELGSRMEFETEKLKELRWFNVSKFDDYLVFYIPASTGIEIVRIIHGARDFPKLFSR